jgi:hypothetical protein
MIGQLHAPPRVFVPLAHLHRRQVHKLGCARTAHRKLSIEARAACTSSRSFVGVVF